MTISAPIWRATAVREGGWPWWLRWGTEPWRAYTKQHSSVARRWTAQDSSVPVWHA
ncbi:unnamed protein product [Periconia digitata]|uniref:Uncharacterized protein n=1 Tax=Periconia digitata TaxID=1303443 RepID=A0A9W4UN21_9PLEO|nr:unnamed protein product [Periconia digitata]